MPCLILYSSFHISCTCWASTSIYAPLKDTNWTSNKPLIGTNWTYRISTSFHGPFWMLSACTYLFHKLLPGANCICTTCNSLHGSSWDAKCACETSTRLYEPLGILIMSLEPHKLSRARGLQSAATKHLPAFTSLCMALTALAESYTSLCGKLTPPTKSLTGFTTFSKELNCTWRTTSSLH